MKNVKKYNTILKIKKKKLPKLNDNNKMHRCIFSKNLEESFRGSKNALKG